MGMARETGDVYRVKLSRIPLFVFLSISGLFVFMGLELSLLHVVFPGFRVNPDKIIVFYAFLFFASVIGVVIMVQMILYIMKPPVMFTSSAEGIAFATGFRYNLYIVPWKHVDSVGSGFDVPGMVVQKKLIFGVVINIKQTNEIPNGLPTSIGVKYEFNMLYLNWIYLGRPAREVIETVTTMKKRFSTAS
jgi:hypothetical protein